MILLHYTATLREPPVEVLKQEWLPGIETANNRIKHLLRKNTEKGAVKYSKFKTTNATTVQR